MNMTEKTVTNEAVTKEERQIMRLKQCLIPAAVISLIIVLYFADFPVISKMPDMFQILMVIANIAIAFYGGSIFCFLKIIFLPFSLMKGFGSIGFLIAFLVWAFYFPFAAFAYIFFSVIPLLIEWFVLQKAIKEYENV